MKISVIIPTYNRADLIVEAIESVFAQTYSNWEMVIVDDGSTDDTEQVVSRFVAMDPRVRYYRQENRGAQAARNHGTALAEGELIAFLDSDDLLHPEKFSKQIQPLIERPDLVGTTCQTAWFDKSIAEVEHLWNHVQVDNHFESFLICNPMWSTLAGLWRTEFIRRMGGWREDLKSSQDVEFHLWAAYYDDNVEYIDEILAYARDHDGFRLTYINRLQWINDFVDITDRIYDRMVFDGRLTPKLSHICSSNYFWCARKLAREGAMEDALRAFAKVAVHQPNTLKAGVVRLWGKTALKIAKAVPKGYQITYLANRAMGLEVRRYNWFKTHVMRRNPFGSRLQSVLPMLAADPHTDDAMRLGRRLLRTDTMMFLVFALGMMLTQYKAIVRTLLG